MWHAAGACAGMSHSVQNEQPQELHTQTHTHKYTHLGSKPLSHSVTQQTYQCVIARSISREKVHAAQCSVVSHIVLGL